MTARAMTDRVMTDRVMTARAMTDDRAALHVRLVAAEAHAAEGHRNIERQRRLIADLERDGRRALQAKQQLVFLQSVQARHLDRLAAIAERLEKLS